MDLCGQRFPVIGICKLHEDQKEKVKETKIAEIGRSSVLPCVCLDACSDAAQPRHTAATY